MPWFAAQQQSMFVKDEPYRRQILVDLKTKQFRLATKLNIEIVIEIGQEFVSVTCKNKDKTAVTIAKLTIPGLMLDKSDLPSIQEACHMLIDQIDDQS